MQKQYRRPWIIIASTVCFVILTYLLSIVIVRTVIFREAQASTEAVIGEITDREEYEVLSSLIESGYTSLPDLFLIEGDTGLGLHNVENGRPWEFAVSDALWDDFISKNQTPSKMGNEFTLSRPYFLFDPKEMFTLGWKMRFARIESTAFSTYSRVGFNQDKNLALVHVSTKIPGRSLQPFVFAFGNWYLLKKSNGKWSIESWQETFIT